MKFVVYKHNKKVGSLSVVNIHEDEVLALTESLDLLCNEEKSYIQYFVSTVSCEMFDYIVNEEMIKYAKKVAMCLSLADNEFCKNGSKSIRRAEYLLNRAKYFCECGAKYLNEV